MKGYVNVVDRQIQGGGITVTQSVRKGLVDLKAYLKSKAIDIDWREAEAFRGPPTSSVSLYYRPGVAFPILQRSLGLAPLATSLQENGDVGGNASASGSDAIGPGEIQVHQYVPTEQDQELGAVLLI